MTSKLPPLTVLLALSVSICAQQPAGTQPIVPDTIAADTLQVTTEVQPNSTDTAATGYWATVTRALDEVVIQAERIVPRGDHLALYLSKENTDFGTNALEAVSSLQLFRTELSGTTLTSYDQKEVFVVINGVPASAMELRSYKGDEIKNVEYYAQTPAEYLSFTSGPVVNVIIKKRHDKAFFGYFDTNNAVHTGFGRNQVALTYADSLNQVKLNYWGDYRYANNITNHTEYVYSQEPTADTTPAYDSSTYDGTTHYQGTYHNINAAYQRYQGRHLFNATVVALLQSGLDDETRTGTLTKNDTTYKYDRGKYTLQSSSQSVSANLYYKYQFVNNGNFSLQVTNQLGTSKSDAAQTLGAADGQDYNISSQVDNTSYSMLATATLLEPLWGGHIAATASYAYRELNQTYSGITYRPYAHNGAFHVRMYWTKDTLSIGTMTFVPGIGVTTRHYYVSTGDTTHTVSPYAYYYTDWWGKGKLKGASIQFTLQAQRMSLSLSDLTDSKTYLDPWFASLGNPTLKPYWSTLGNLAFCYFRPNTQNYVILKLNTLYEPGKQVPTIVRTADEVLLQPQNIKSVLTSEISLYGTWHITKWLEFSPYAEYHISRFATPSQEVALNYPRIGSSFIFTFGGATITLALNSPTKTYNGDLLYRGSAQYAAAFQYKIKNWSLGASYNYMNRDRTYIELPDIDFNYYQEKNWKSYNHLVRVQATYSFSVGRSRNQPSVRNSTVDDNTGLGTFNKVQLK